jgi:hypothetical protein
MIGAAQKYVSDSVFGILLNCLFQDLCGFFILALLIKVKALFGQAFLGGGGGGKTSRQKDESYRALSDKHIFTSVKISRKPAGIQENSQMRVLDSLTAAY